jgi:Asp-tRNA(Asn)/Glu-tRNA(Gln) amidotransferase C subunit
MTPVSEDLLRSMAAELARVPVEPEDLPSVAAQLGAQIDGMARLDELGLQDVEPATVLVPPTEAPDAR